MFTQSLNGFSRGRRSWTCLNQLPFQHLIRVRGYTSKGKSCVVKLTVYLYHFLAYPLRVCVSLYLGGMNVIRRQLPPLPLIRVALSYNSSTTLTRVIFVDYSERLIGFSPDRPCGDRTHSSTLKGSRLNLFVLRSIHPTCVGVLLIIHTHFYCALD